MQITLIAIGKTKDKHLIALITDYVQRINRYSKFIIKELPDIKNAASLNTESLLKKEAELLLKNISPNDSVVLLDSTGKQNTSDTFAKFIAQKQVGNTNSLVFIIGGAYGFHKSIYNAFPEKCSLATLTFTHQMVRLIFCEQLYRAFTIINNEPYHHT
ncbi:MAG: 23S rRNA (pseudouridine(1915)-N(3))-methyltransferase RlmH [Bacteroidetes bacterium]|nr:23S rRNA (pseudouridine(1915)-N(3))-methyltransferase RlmH [Bacteroidota bacterium]